MKVGDKVNGLTMISKSHKCEDGRYRALFLCECGNKKEIRTEYVKSGKTKHCGCMISKGWHRTHGLCGTKIYHVWEVMKCRCYLKSSKDYANYGGRGIVICDEWKDPKVFCDWAMANGYKEGLSIDRINNNGNYEPSNCRWVDNFAQANNKRNNLRISYKGETKTLAQWCNELEIPYKRTHLRLRRGWDVERAFNT